MEGGEVTISALRDGIPPQPRTAFVLGGGGPLGAVQVGMLQAVLARGLQPDMLLGCSVGAINAVCLAGAPTPAGGERLAEIWRGLEADSIIASGHLSRLWLLARKGLALQSNDGLRALIESSIDYGTFEEAAVELHVVATSMRTGRERWFSSGEVVEPVLASAALPAIFPPVEIDGELFIDGAVVDNVPISRAVALGATRVVVFHVGNFERPRPLPRRPLDVLLQSFSIARNYRFLAEVEHPPPGVELITLPSIDPGPTRYNDFARSHQLIERARAAAAAFLDTRIPTAAAGT
jgi:NTE family protein